MSKAKWLFSAVAFGLTAVGCGNSDDSGGGTSQGGSLAITVSAEALGAEGYGFPPAPGQEVAFADGWEVKFDRILVAVDNVRLSEAPDKNPGNQGEVGPEVARRSGPWVVDAAKPGTAEDKGGAGMVATRLPIDDLRGFFDLEKRYAFSFDLVPATTGAKPVNLDASDPDFLEMVASGYRLLLIGTATFKASNAECRGSLDGYAWQELPDQVTFRFGFAGAASSLNCQNPDNTGAALEGEESQRGIQLVSNAETVAQITVHTDHLFWGTVSHEAVPLFDQFAANAKLVENRHLVTLDDLTQVPIAPITDASGAPLPWRSCVSEAMYKLPTNPSHMTFETMGQAITTLREFVSFNARTMGHLNADGLCYVAGG